MGRLKEKLKSVLDSITVGSSIAIEEIIKKNKQYIDAILEVTIKSEKGINALKNYAEIESSSLGKPISSLTKIYESLEETRKEKTAKLNANFIAPLEELLIAFKKLQEELKSVEDAKTAEKKAKQKYDNEQSKPASKKIKLKEKEKLEEAEVLYIRAKEEYNKRKQETEIKSKDFNTKKTETFKKVVNNAINIEKKFHESILSKIKNLEEKIGTTEVME